MIRVADSKVTAQPGNRTFHSGGFAMQGEIVRRRAEGGRANLEIPGRRKDGRSG